MSGLANAGLFAIDAGLRRWRGTPNGAGYVAAVARLPKGFFDDSYQNGLAVAYMAVVGDRYIASISCHRPGDGIKALSRQWSQMGFEDATTRFDTTPSMSAVMGSQELGEFSYALFTRSAGAGSGSTAGLFGWSQHLVRFNQSSYVESRYHHPFSPAGSVLYTLSASVFMESPYPEAPFNLGSWNGALHVSDTYPPRLWQVQGDRVLYWVDSDDPRQNAAPFQQRWRQRTNMAQGGSILQGPWRIQFQGAHYVQFYPTNSQTRGPILVRPWANHSADPELWFFVKGHLGGYRIYRSSWRPGNWKLPKSPFGNNGYGTHAAAIDNNMAVIQDFGDGAYPKFNPSGYAFDHNWLKESNAVGSFFGEPRGVSLLNAGIKIVRDSRRIGRLHMIVNGGPSPSGYYGASYYAQSNNDGATWSRLRRISPMPKTSGTNLNHGGAGDHNQGTVTPRGMVVVPGRGRIGGSNVRSLLALNPNAGGVTSKQARPYVYRRGAAKGSEWL